MNDSESIVYIRSSKERGEKTMQNWQTFSEHIEHDFNTRANSAYM